MIPTFELLPISERIELLKENLRPIDVEDLESMEANGHFMNQDFQLIYDTPIEEVLEIIGHEKSIISEVIEKSNSHEEFEELLEEFEDASSDLFHHGIEYGVKSIIYALSTTKCVTITGCRSHIGYSYAPQPMIGVHVDWERYLLIKKLADTIPEEIELDAEFFIQALIISGKSVLSFIKLAELIVENKSTFDKIKSQF